MQWQRWLTGSGVGLGASELGRAVGGGGVVLVGVGGAGAKRATMGGAVAAVGPGGGLVDRVAAMASHPDWIVFDRAAVLFFAGLTVLAAGFAALGLHGSGVARM